MPALVRRYVKTAFVYFVAALLAGVVLAAQSATDAWSDLPLLPVYFHLFMVGWVTQLIFGIALWMFPKFSPEQPRGSEWLAQATWLLLNTGLALRVVGEPLRAVRPEPLWGWLLVLSAGLQWLAGMAFVANTWGRVKGR